MFGMKGSRIGCLVLGLGVLVGPQVQPVSAQSARRSSDGDGPVGLVLPESRAELGALVNEELGLYSSTVVSLDIDPIVGTELRVVVPIAGTWHTMVLAPYSVRSPEYRLLVQGPDGSLSAVVPGPERTLRGGIVGIEGSIVAASMLDDGLHAMIAMSPDEERVWLEPIAARIFGAGINDYVVYRDADVIGTEGTCGTADKAAADAHIEASSGVKVPDGVPGGAGRVAGLTLVR